MSGHFCVEQKSCTNRFGHCPMNINPKSYQDSEKSQETAQSVRFDQSSGDSRVAPIGEEKPVIQLQGVQKSFGNWTALENVDLMVTDRVTGLLGPNGAGKSTLIKILLGLVKPSAGSGSFFGMDISSDPLGIRQVVGFMPEDDCFIDGLTGIQSVEMSAKFFGMPAPESLRRAHEVLDFCGFKQERYREVSGYSTGMRQLVKFASAIVHNPKFLILDEPTTGLDPEERERLLRRVKWLNQEFGIGAMLSTHILPDVQSICDNVVIMAGGRVCENKKLVDFQKTGQWTVSIVGGSEGNKINQLADLLEQNGWPSEIVSATEMKFHVDPSTNPDTVSETIWKLALQIDAVILQASPADLALDEIFLQTVKGNQ